MRRGLRTLSAFAALAFLTAYCFIEGSARPLSGADPFRAFVFILSLRLSGTDLQAERIGNSNLPAPVRFRESKEAGLLLKVWVNDAGPYTFALDTGAGANILSRRVASEARVEVNAGGGAVRIGGLSGAATTFARRAYVRSFAAGTSGNRLPTQGYTVIADRLPEEIDGVLDPTEVFGSLGFTIDIPAGTLSVFDPRVTPIEKDLERENETVVGWLREQGSNRPFVLLSSGRRALIDTGSGFGLAVNGEAARSLGILPHDGGREGGAQDLAGGRIASRRVRPVTVHIGSLALRNIPTDFIQTTHGGAPILLGRDALRPFQISFDPLKRLIRFRHS